MALEFFLIPKLFFGENRNSGKVLEENYVSVEFRFAVLIHVILIFIPCIVGSSKWSLPIRPSLHGPGFYGRAKPTE